MKFEAISLIIWAIVAGSAVLGGITIFGLQCFWYLQSGYWTSMSVIDIAVRYFGMSWAIRPTDWLGLHKILSYVPVSLVAILGGYGMIAVKDA